MDKIKTEQVTDQYYLEECISEGAYSEVFRAVHKDYEKQVAIKRFKKFRLPTDISKRFHDFYELYSKLEHPNLAGIIQAYDNKQYICLVSEYLTGGQLFDWNLRLPHRDQTVVCDIVKTLCDVLDYCHNHGLIHRNLKPQNILIGLEHGNNVIKVVDFGIHKIVGQALIQKSFGHELFDPPEVFQGKQYDSKSDFWSLGIIMYMLLSGKPPFRGSASQIKQKIQQGKIQFPQDDWKYISTAAQDLVFHLLDSNPQTRYNSAKVFNHPWMVIMSSMKREHPELMFNLKRFTSERKLQKMQFSLKSALTSALQRISKQ